jgi:uncharacterized repeat protein (TIGR03803 family)
MGETVDEPADTTSWPYFGGPAHSDRPPCAIGRSSSAVCRDSWRADPVEWWLDFPSALPVQEWSGGCLSLRHSILDSEGNLYGTTCNDGAFASGTVWKLSPDGKHTALYSFKQTGGGERAELDRALRRPWIEVTSGRSNESRINGLKHHAQEALTGFVTF